MTLLRRPCDALCVCEHNGAVWIGIGWDSEPEPREWFGMDATEALNVAQSIREAVAVLQEHQT
jgi:hypothetical protein